MTRLIELYSKALSLLMALALAIMVVLVFGNVVLRYGFNAGITVSEELSRWLFVWMTFMGAVVALKEHGHLGTDVLVARLPAAGKRACLIVAQLAMFFVTWLLLTGSWTQAKINLDVAAPVTGLSGAIFYGSGVFFAVSALLLLVRELWRTVSGAQADADLVMVQESEEVKQVEALHLDHSLDRPVGR